MMLALLSFLAACATYPRPGDVVTMEINWAVGLDDAIPRDAGIRLEDVKAGRVLLMRCATSTDSWWSSLAVLPEHAAHMDRRVWTMLVLDRGTNDRRPVNPLLAPVEPPLGQGGLAYRPVLDWRERGLWTNVERQPPAGGPESNYLVIQGSWVIRCRR